MKMKVSKAWLGAAALLVLGSVPQLAEAQLEYCVATYTDFDVDTTQGEVEAWAWVEDYFNVGDCQVGGGYQWGYFEHSYYASVSIESPTQNTAYHYDDVLMPYGGGSAYAETAISFFGDPGNYVVRTIIQIICSVGGIFVDLDEEDVINLPNVISGPVTIRLSFDDGPTCCGSTNTTKVLAALEVNAVQNGIPATFFVQTHVANRGGAPDGSGSQGIPNMAAIHQAGHDVMVHTGWPVDHVLHTARVLEPGYEGGQTGLDGDLIVAKQRIDLATGVVPPFVRAPEGAGINDPAVQAAYARQNLTHKWIDMKSGDDVGGADFESIVATLSANLIKELIQQNNDITILFHDIHARTADNMIAYLQTIEFLVQVAGGTVQFAKVQ